MEAAGFVPHYVDYPLGDVPAAVAMARAEAAALRERFGAEAVYAYGSSAGGTLAALLAGEGLVAAALAKAPPSDLVGWSWPLSTYGEDFYEEIGLSAEARYRLSPLRRPERRPLLLLQGRVDEVVPLTMSEAFAAKFRQAVAMVTDDTSTPKRSAQSGSTRPQCCAPTDAVGPRG